VLRLVFERALNNQGDNLALLLLAIQKGLVCLMMLVKRSKQFFTIESLAHSLERLFYPGVDGTGA